jgi:hypothetical protein
MVGYKVLSVCLINIVKMNLIKTLYQVYINDVDFKNMPNNEEFYFVVDRVGNKRIHRCEHIKLNPNNFKFVMLDKSQLSSENIALLNLEYEMLFDSDIVQGWYIMNEDILNDISEENFAKGLSEGFIRIRK